MSPLTHGLNSRSACDMLKEPNTEAPGRRGESFWEGASLANPPNKLENRCKLFSKVWGSTLKTKEVFY